MAHCTANGIHDEGQRNLELGERVEERTTLPGSGIAVGSDYPDVLSISVRGARTLGVIPATTI